MHIYPWILTLAIVAGQLIKLPILNNGGVTLLDIVVIFFAIFGLFKLKLKLKKAPQFLTPALIFIAMAVLSLILTPLHLSFLQYLTSFLYTIRFSSYILLGWEIYSGAYPIFKKDGSVILITSGLILAVLGLLQLIFLPDLRFLTVNGWDPHYFRTVSTFLDPNYLGGYFALTLILLAQNYTKVKWNLLFFIPVYLGLLTTFSRGAYLAFFVSFLTLSLLKKSLKLGLLTCLLTLGLFFGYANYQRSIAEPRHINREQSAQFRLSAWQQGLTLFQQAPILGVGFNSYRYALRQFHLAGEDFLKTHGSSTNDSSLLFVASTTGVIGLTFYLLFLASLIKTSWNNYKQKNTRGEFIIAALSGLLVQSFFANILFYPFILIWISLKAVDITD